MPDIFADEIRTVSVPCSVCGTTVELANTAMSVFESPESVQCLECLIGVGPAFAGGDDDIMTVPLQERIAVIDDVVAAFSLHLRNVLVRSIKPDLSWNTHFNFESWENPSDALASAHAPSIWYAMRPHKTPAGL